MQYPKAELISDQKPKHSVSKNKKYDANTAMLDNIIVVKVGTNTMFRQQDGHEVLDLAAMKQIGQQLLSLKKRGHNIVVVSSGAVTAGMQATKTIVRPKSNSDMPEVQRLATIGWHRVMAGWDQALAPVIAGGLLLTQRELSLASPERDEALRTTYTLLKHGNIAVLNENDAITHGELAVDSFGQNDELAATFVAQIAKSNLFGNNIKLILLSDVDGVYEDINDRESIIRNIPNIDSYAHVAGKSGSKNGTGGMHAKFQAAKIAKAAGIDMWVTNGKVKDSIILTLDGKLGTYFPALEHTEP